MDNMRARVETELRTNILPFWLEHAIDEQYGGFRGQIANDLTIDPFAPKGLILNARILWAFSKAFSVYGEEVYRQTARRAYDYITSISGIRNLMGSSGWWILGRPVEIQETHLWPSVCRLLAGRIYCTTGDQDALDPSAHALRSIESASHDSLHGGYFETYERDWTLAREQRLSVVDMDEKKSMNTHLHLSKLTPICCGARTTEKPQPEPGVRATSCAAA